jgi:hypothetical protein
MSYYQQMQMLDFFNENGVTHVNLSVLSRAEDGARVMKGDARARDMDEAARSLKWSYYENQRGGEVYIRPSRFLSDGTPAAWPMIFFDDVAIEILQKIRKRALVIETSPGSFHVWLPCDRPLTENERRREQMRIQPLLKSDPASIGGEHFGRLPGFKNHKRGGVMVRIFRKVMNGPLLVPSAPAPAPTGTAPTVPYFPPPKGARVL